MGKRHIIAEAVFDISFDSALAAREQEPGLGAFIQNRLLPLADEICSELSSDGAVSRIERLEVDLGDISYSGFRGEMESRFKEKFRLALQDKIQSLAPAYSYSPSAIEGIVSEPQAEREQLEHFLETGRMARNDDHGTREASDELLARAVQHSGKGLVEFLKKTPKQDIVVKRLVKQFSDQHLAAIMQLLAPAHARLLGNLVGKFGKTWKADVYGIPEKEFKSLIWERLINELLKSANGASDPERLFRKTARTLFLQHAKSQNTVDGEMPPHKNGEPVHEANHQEELPERMSQERLLAARLEAALVEGNAGEISGSWDEICRNHAGLVRETFARRMGDESARDKLAEGFPEAMLHDLIRILIPTESHFLQALANELHTAGATSARNSLIWKHALGYLHAAAGYDRSGHALSFSAYLSGQPHQDSLARETGQQEEIVPPNMATAGMPRVEALYQRLVQRMRSARPEGEMAQEIEELARNYPETIERLYRRLQSGEIRANIAGLTAGEARRLATSFIGLNQGGGEAGFRRAIEAQAKSAPSEQRYYQFILEKLIGSQIVDLEEAAQCHEAVSPDEDSRRNSTPASPEAVVEPQPENEEPALEYVELLRTLLEEALVLGRVEGVVERWDELCLNHADLVRDAFIRRMGDESARDKLARGFPEAMLRDLIGILVPMESHFIATLAKQSELHTGETGTSGDVNMALWTFTLAYLHAVELSGYERAAYVFGLIGHLAGQGLPSAFIRQAYADLSMEKRLTDRDYEIALVQETGQETIAPEAALGEAQEAAQESNAEAPEQHRSRLEAALTGGNAFELSGIWGDLCFHHADLVCETYRRRMGDPELRKNLAQGFPEAMLLDLIRLLAPQESSFIEALVRQPELRAESAGSSTILRALWEHTLAYLHGAGARSFSRMEYTRGLTPLMAEQGMDQAKLRQAISRIDPSLSAVLAEFVPEAETPETPKRRTERAAELYEQLKRHLSGKAPQTGAPPDLAAAIEELANAYPEALSRLHRQLQAGEIRAQLGLLSAREARQLTAALIGLNHGGKESEFQRAIEAHAGKAQNEQRYYRHILEKLLHNQIIDLEAALDEAQEAAQEPNATAEAPAEREQHRSRLEAALAGGDASGLSGIWGDLCFNHAELVRETCRRVMGEPGLRKNLAQGFPEHMLLDLIRLLAPQESSFIEALARQPELRAESTGSSAILRALWEHTLAYLHGAGARSFSRMEYTRGLTPLMVEQGMDQAKLRQAITRIDPSLSAVLAEFVPEAETPEMPKRQPARAAELYEQLKRHLSGKAPQTGAPPDLAPAIEELANTYPETLARLYRQLQAGEIRANLGLFSAREARQLTAALIGLNHGGKESEFQRAIEAHAGKAQNGQRYYRHILEKLLHDQIIDLEAALSEVQEAAAESNATAEREQHRSRLETALAGGNAFELSGIWGDLCFHHADLIRETCRRVMGDPGQRKNLAQGFPEAMLLDLIRLLAPQESGFIGTLSKQPELRAESTGSSAVLRALWEHTLAYLHAMEKGGFSRTEYARSLISWMAGQGLERSALLQALRRTDASLEKALAETPPESGVDETPKLAQHPPAASTTAEAPDIKLLRSRLEAALAGGNASGLSGIWGDLCFNHADLVRETCRRVMGDPGLRKNLAQGFPEAMLLDLIRLLAPQESSFIEALVRQPELRAESTGSSTILRALWEHTLAYLHGAGARSFSRMEYTRGLTPLMVEQGMDQAKLRQAISRIDPSLSAVLAEFVPEDETPEMPKRQPARAAELYEQIKRHLSGKAPQTGAPTDLAPAIEELANTYPETLARLHRQLQAGEIRANLGVLSAREARQLTAALIGLNHGGKESEFQRAIEAHAGKAQNEQRYYRHILEKLLHNQIIDLEAALGEAQDAAQESSATAEAPAEREQHRSRLEAALAEGNASELSGIWGDLCFNHAELVRETYRRRMGEPGLRKNLAQGFPEAMLLDLIRLLAPQESNFIEALARQPELRAESAGSSTILLALWEHTLAYLHGAGTRSFSRMEYTRGLTPLMVEQGMEQAKLRQAITRIDPTLSAVLAEFVPEAETPKRQTARADELYEQLKRHLSGKAPQTGAPPDLAPAIEELADTYPETLARLYHQLQAGEIRANLGLLSAREARQLTAALIGLNHGGKESEFQRAIEAHAENAQNEQRYYRHILEKLLDNQIVDLEAALSEAQENAENIHLQVKGSQPSVAAKPRPEGAKVSTRDANRRGEMEETTEEIYIANAGMVLVTPYLPQLFRMLGLTEGSKFKNERAAERAIHLLQYTVNESCDSPEFLLALNKIMCGLVTGIPIVRGIELLPVEKETIEGMLKAIIQRWTIIGNTSVQGLRESFLQRGGRLQLGEDGWRLKVEKKGIDVLLDRLPWSISIVKHPWMALPIYVEW